MFFLLIKKKRLHKEVYSCLIWDQRAIATWNGIPIKKIGQKKLSLYNNEQNIDPSSDHINTLSIGRLNTRLPHLILK